jgi:predicted nucleic acid-binding protein
MLLFMAGNVLVDSSFYIARLRAGLDPFEEFGEHTETCDFFTCGIVKMEVLRGVKYKNAHRRMSDLMDCMFYVPTPNALWERAERVAWELDRTGRVVQVTDLIIAVCALEADATVLTFDSDFGNIPGLRTLRRLG